MFKCGMGSWRENCFSVQKYKNKNESICIRSKATAEDGPRLTKLHCWWDFICVYRLRPILEAKDRSVGDIVKNHCSSEVVV